MKFVAGDLIEFYKTPVDTTTPLDALKKMDLPKNLHVQQDYVRFHPGMFHLCVVNISWYYQTN